MKTSVSYLISPPIEAAMMRQAGTNLIPAPQNQGGYSMDKDCVFLIKQEEKKYVIYMEQNNNRGVAKIIELVIHSV